MFLAIIIFVYLTLPYVALGLFMAHWFFDPEGAVTSDKQYENGYVAWSFALIGTLLTVLGIRIPFWGSHILITMGILHLACHSYMAFSARKRGNPRNKKYTTDALAKLLERCKEWLVPRPIPQT
jgi:hypothetical protein